KQDAEQTTKSLRGMAKGLGAVAAAAIGIGGVGALFRNVAREAEVFETSMFKINAIIRATGGVAGKTGDDLLTFAKSLALNTLESTEGVLEAQQRLLTFRKVTGDVFDRTIRAAADLSAAMGTNLSGATLQLGKALEDPVTGLTMLTRTGTVFTETQKEMIKSLVEAGKLQAAQGVILKELEAQYGGTAQAAAQGYAGALDTLAQRQQEFLLAINDTLGVTDKLAAAINGLASVFNVLAENMGRVVSYIATAAVAGMVAFRGAILAAGAAIMKVLIPSLVGLKAALIRTGIGALVVLAGEAIYQLSRLWSWFGELKKAAGGFGAAVGLLKDIAFGTFNKIIAKMEVLKVNFKIQVTQLLYLWERGLSKMKVAFARFLDNIAAISPAFMGLEGGFEAAAVAEAEAVATQLGTQIAGLNEAREKLRLAAGRPIPALEQARELIAGLNGEGEAPPSPPGTPDVDAPPGGGGTDFTTQLDALRNYFKTRKQILIEEYAEEREMLRQALLAGQIADQEEFQELSLISARRYQEQMAALEREAADARLKDTGTAFGALAKVAEQGGKGMAKAAATFGAVEALINAYRAATQALADPTKVTPAQKFAAYASVLAAGLGAVNAIKSAGSQVGGGGGGAVASTAAASAPAPLDVRLSGVSADEFISGASIQSLFDRLQDEAGDRGLRVSFA
ncbi:MAG: phage tail length tape measure family protein, partial [Betaproteobacteria bacterium]